MQLKNFYWILSIFLIISLSIGSIVAVDSNSLTNLTNVDNSHSNNAVNYNQDNDSYLENENVVNNNEDILKYDDLNTSSTVNGGIRNISFTNGYNGYCINMSLHNAESGQTFTVTNTSNIINHLDGSNVGEYIKILFYNYWDIVNSDKTATSDAIWRFTDRTYIPYTGSDYDGPVVSLLVTNVLSDYNNGLRVPDHGAVKKINETSEMVFDFISLISGSDSIQNYFGYKVTMQDITQNNTTNNTNITSNSTNTTGNNTNNNNTNNSTNMAGSNTNNNNIGNSTNNNTNITNNTTNTTGNNTNNNNTANSTNNNTDSSNNITNSTNGNNTNSTMNNNTLVNNQNNKTGTGLYNTGNPLYVLFAALMLLTALPFYRKK